MKLTGKRCQCGACRLYFRSLGAFDKHRTGTYGQDRRCRNQEEMRAAGMVQLDSGVWVGSAWTWRPA